MTDPIFLAPSILEKIINSNGKEKNLRCLFNDKITTHISTSLAETYDSSMGKVVGRVNDYNPASWAISGGFYVCKDCGMFRFDGGLLSDSKNDEILSEAKKRIELYKVYFHNKTGENIVVAIHFSDFTSNWKTGDWYTKYWAPFEPWEKALLFYSKEPYFYYYAKSSNGSEWSGKDYKTSINGEIYEFKRREISCSSWGEFTLSLTQS